MFLKENSKNFSLFNRYKKKNRKKVLMTIIKIYLSFFYVSTFKFIYSHYLDIIKFS